MFLLIVATIGGGIGVIRPSLVSVPVTASFDYPWQIAWFASLALTSVIALLGARRHDVPGLLMERVGLLIQGVLMVAYAVAVFGASRTIGAPMFFAGFAVADWLRAWVITRVLRMLPPGERQPRRGG